MGITLPTTYNPLALGSFQPGARVHEGFAATEGELDLVRNVNFLQGYLAVQIVATHFSSEATVVGSVYCLESNGGGATVRASWRRRVFRDLTTVRCIIDCANTGPATPGDDTTVTFRCASDHTKKVDITVPGGTAAWTRLAGTFAYNPALGAYETIEMLVADGATGNVRIRSVSIWLEPLGSIAAGITAEGVVSLDDTEASSASPLSVYLRQTEFDNLDLLRRTRTPTLVGWSEDAALRVAANAAYRTQSGTRVTMARLDFRSPFGCSELEFAVAGYRTGASGSVRLQTGWMKMQGLTPIDVALGNAASWVAPYPFTDDGGTRLITIPNANDYVEVQLLSDGAGYSYLMGLNVWPRDFDA